MSYIDTFDHEFVGFFGGYPIYHPLESVEGDPTNLADFSCTPSDLVLGGGGGEHPAVVLRRADCAVAQFVQYWLDDHNDETRLQRLRQSPLEVPAWEPFLDMACTIPSQSVLDFAGWNVQTYHDFYAACCSAMLYRPYHSERDGRFESWLAACLGELIFFAMPDLVPELTTLLPDAREHIHSALFLNVLTPPPGYQLPLGRKIVDGKAVWGNHRWWTDREK
jgi:hypothetical protein